jgi:hypothetical protein
VLIVDELGREDHSSILTTAIWDLEPLMSKLSSKPDLTGNKSKKKQKL